jgi:GTPase SAR1 family protein
MVRATLRKKIVIVGDGACGKTSLLIVYQNGKFPEVMIYTCKKKKNDTHVCLMFRNIYLQYLKITFREWIWTISQWNWLCGTLQDKKIMID